MNVIGARDRFVSIFVSRSLAGRDLGLDVFRGIAIFAMIMVNHAPPGSTMYAPFVHMEWHGWSMADVIFPAFLFAVGVSIAWVLPSPAKRGGTGAGSAMYFKILRRCALLVAISVMLVNAPYFEWGKIKVAGVLAQIAWCYLVVAMVQLHVTWRGQLAITIVILLVHWAVLALVDVPQFGPGSLTPEGNAARYVDHLVLGRNSANFEMGEKSPYGLLVIFSSLSTTMIGSLTGHWLHTTRDAQSKISGLFVAGFLFMALSQLWDHILPINKLLWSGSFVALTAGISLQLLACIYWGLGLAVSKRWSWPLQVAGVNALFFYVFAQCLQRFLVYGRIQGDDGVSIRLRVLIWDRMFTPWISGKEGALLYTLMFTLVCFSVMVFMFRRKVFVRL